MHTHDESLKTLINGFQLINPFIIASASPTANLEMILRAFEAGWAGVVTKTIKPDSMEIKDVSPRFHALQDSKGEVVGFENIELVSKKGETYWVNTVQVLKKTYPDRMVIASLMGDSTPETWQHLAKKMEAAGADALELNFSCPHGMPEKGVGAAIGQDPEITAKITGWVKAVARIPVIVKLTPNVTDIRVTAKAAVSQKADAIAAINTVESISGVDLDSMTPFPLVHGQSAYGGYSGAGVKPIGLKAVSQIASTIDQPIYGIGGIRTWKDAAEYIALGATAVQVCTEVMVKGFKIINPLTQGLSKFLEEKGYSKLSDIQGKALVKLSRHEKLTRETRVMPTIIKSQDCIQCGQCVTACRDGGYQAISLIDHKIVINESLCDGCALCRYVCPKKIIDMIAVPAAS